MTMKQEQSTDSLRLPHTEPRISKGGTKQERKKKKGKLSTKKQKMLLEMIASELEASMNDKLPESSPPTSENARSASAEDIFYAQMNGEGVGTDLIESLDVTNSSGYDESDFPEMDDFPDHLSFAYFDASETNGTDDVYPPKPSSRWSNGSAESENSNTSRSYSSEEYSPDIEDTSSSELSMREIQEFVMESLPQDVKDKIPASAWDEIFGPSSPSKTRRPVTVGNALPGLPLLDASDEDGSKSAHSNVSQGMDNLYQENQYKKNTEENLHSSFRVSEEVTQPSAVKKSVAFDCVMVRNYERIMDVNPSVTSGAAVGIGWRYKRDRPTAIDLWESRKNYTRTSDDLLLPRQVRDQMLRDLGYSQKAIAQGTRACRKLRDQRKTTIDNLGAQSMEEAVERASKVVKGFLHFGRNKGILRDR